MFFAISRTAATLHLPEPNYRIAAVGCPSIIEDELSSVHDPNFALSKMVQLGASNTVFALRSAVDTVAQIHGFGAFTRAVGASLYLSTYYRSATPVC